MSPRTTDYINKKSPNYIERSPYMGKTGSNIDGTHASHRFSVGLANVISTNHEDLLLSKDEKIVISEELNNKKNLRIKLASTNLNDDEENDGKIAKCICKGGSLSTDSEKRRLAQAMEGAKTLTNKIFIGVLEKVRIYDEETKGYKTAKKFFLSAK